MACLCDHTMQKVNDGIPTVFWCPRCGTLKTEGCVPEFESPMIVKRVKVLVEIMVGNEEPIDAPPAVIALIECLHNQ